ncbi:MAG: N-acetyltransferase [Alistipes sp.]
MDAEIQIEQAGKADLDSIVQIENSCFEADNFSRRQLSYLIGKARGGCFIARMEGKAVAYICLIWRLGNANLRIYSLAVLPAARGRKAAQALIDKSIEYARQQGLTELTLEVKSDNTAALGLYTKNMFCRTSILPGYYHDGTDAWHMKREVQ